MDEKGKALFDRLLGLETEARNPRTSDLDSLEPIDIVRRINDEDATVADAVREVLDDVARHFYDVALPVNGRTIGFPDVQRS